MNKRRPLPVGPLALALRHLRPSGPGGVAALAVVLGLALLAGIALLFSR